VYDQLKIIFFEGDSSLRAVADRFNELKRTRGVGIPREVWERHGAHYPPKQDKPTPIPEHKRSAGGTTLPGSVSASPGGGGNLPLGSTAPAGDSHE